MNKLRIDKFFPHLSLQTCLCSGIDSVVCKNVFTAKEVGACKYSKQFLGMNLKVVNQTRVHLLKSGIINAQQNMEVAPGDRFTMYFAIGN